MPKRYKTMKTVMIMFILLSQLTFQACSKEENKMETKMKDILVVAHRGASGYAPENTLAAMKKAIEMNAEMSELDVQETADWEIILLHDNTTERTGKRDLNIWELNYSELKDIERLEESLIGRNVKIFRNRKIHKALRLMIGDDSVVEI